MPIARKANAEAGCTGHFWEARFHSQALLSDQALIMAMAYVDLNPIRAQIAKTPEESAYTSIKVRLRGEDTNGELREAISSLIAYGDINHFRVRLRRLAPFSGEAATAIPMGEQDYFTSVDEMGRVTARGKRGRIDADLSPILRRIGLSEELWSVASSRKYPKKTA